MNSRKIVITGGPSTGKTSIIKKLKDRGYYCLDEISRQVTLEAREEGIEHLFLSDPLLFSQKLLEGRIAQFKRAEQYPENLVFLDRGIPDVLAYMDFVGSQYPQNFNQACLDYRYDVVFLLAPWQEIFISDEVRYENFEEAKQIHLDLKECYIKFGYNLLDVPFANVDKRVDHILNALKA